MAKRYGKPTVDEEDGPEGLIPSAIAALVRPSFPGYQALMRRFGRRKTPRFDPARAHVFYRPVKRVTEWDGPAELHTTDECVLPFCDHPGEVGRHTEVRPHGFYWGGVYFSCLEEGLANQAFVRWYEEGFLVSDGSTGKKGKDVMKKGKLVLRDPLYGVNEESPLPPYNFYLDEHLHEMTSGEINAFKKRGEVPKRLRRRGRGRAK